MAVERVSFTNECYHQLFLNEKQTIKQLNPSDDGAHRVPGDKYFEWWYFDVNFDNGYHLVVAFHGANFNVISRPSVITIHLYNHKGFKVEEIQHFKNCDVRISKEKCDITFGPNRVWDADNHYILQLNQGRIQANLKFHREEKGIQIGTGVLFSDVKSNQSFHWNIPLPRAHVTGQFKIDDSELEVKGLGYHDHNWGKLDLHFAFRKWIWGRVLAEDFTLIIADLIDRFNYDNRLKLFLLWERNNLTVCTENVNIEMLKYQNHSDGDYIYPTHYKLNTENDLHHFQSDFKTEQILDLIRFALPYSKLKKVRQMKEAIYYISYKFPMIGKLIRNIMNQGVYVRLQAKCNLKVTKHGQEKKLNHYALCEIMDFGNNI